MMKVSSPLVHKHATPNHNGSIFTLGNIYFILKSLQHSKAELWLIVIRGIP